MKMAYLAGAFEERGKIYELPNANIGVSFRSTRKTAIFLKSQFGGTLFLSGSKKRYWYKAQGANAVNFLKTVLPYLKYEKSRVRKLLSSYANKQVAAK